MHAVQECEKLAYEYGHQELAQEHLLYGLVKDADGVIPKLLVKMGMEPEVFAGDIVGVVRVEAYDKISPDAIYMIVTNDARMIKHCYIDENNPELLWCVSPNYPSFPINRADICAMFRVVSRIQYF